MTTFVQVENTIFRVLQHGFTDASPLFEGMFLRPIDDGDHKERGRTKDNPIVLEGYKASDFEALLRVLYPS